MRNKIFQILTVGITTLMLLSFSVNIENYQIECVSTEIDGYITIKIWNTQKGSAYKPEQAQKDAIKSILFSGISGNNGCTTQPPLLNKTEDQLEFKKIEKTFFSKNGKWIVFIRSSAKETTLPSNLGNSNWKIYQLYISKNELRKYLEEQKIIKSLNNGF